MTDIWKNTGIIATGIIVLMIPLALLLHSSSSPGEKKQAEFVGGNQCITCHQREYNLWKGSDHDNAMNIATDSTVLGDFKDVEVELNGTIHKFYKHEGKFYVYTKGFGGKMAEFEISYTFGIRPLQQYLIPFEKGKYQCLPIAWDTNKKMWFDMAGMVYKPDELKPESWFYWTNQSQNWNGMCAECHSTNLRKNYNVEEDSFNTTWSDIDVNCEACHGPGSDHLDWAKLPEGARDNDGNKGLVLITSNATSKQYVEACAPCHSRRTSFGPNEHRDGEYYNNNRPQNISPPLYYSDGQILDEDYEFGSFTQSKMYMHDVKCNDCHDSHSLKLKFDGNALCTQCHRAAEYDTYQHHFHKYKNESGNPVKDKSGNMVPVGDGALCKTCHMPGRFYMGVDLRRDHSLRIPRPDLSIIYNVPNACNDCHADKSYQWAEDFIKKYYGERKRASFGVTLSEGYLQKVGADIDLIKLIKSDLYPEIVRAAAISYLASYNTPEAKSIIKEMIEDPEPIIRERAVDAFNPDNPDELVKTLTVLLNDPVKMVRIAAASKLSALARENFTDDQYRVLEQVLDQYLNTLMYTADFPSGKFNLGNFYSNKGNYVEAEKFYNDAIRTDSMFFPAKSNLALLYYNSGELKKAEEIFLDLIRKHPEFTDGNYYLGLLYAEQKRYKEAAEVLEQAALSTNPTPRIYYNLGLIYQYLNHEAKAESSLKKAYALSPDEFDILYALCDFYINQKRYQEAEKYVNDIKIKFPSNPAGSQISEFIEQLKEKK